MLCFACIMCKKKTNFLIRLSFFPINSLLSSQNIYLGSCPNSIVACPFYTLRNMANYKNKCQVIIFYFGPFHSCDIIYWLRDKNYTNVALGPIGRWLSHCLGDKSWTLKGILGVLWLIHVFLRWLIMHSTNKGCPHSLWP